MVQDTRFTHKCIPSDKRLRLSQPYKEPNIDSDEDSEDYDDTDSDDEMNYDLLCFDDFDENEKVLTQEQRNTRCMKRNVEKFCKIISHMRVIDGNFRVNIKSSKKDNRSMCLPFS